MRKLVSKKTIKKIGKLAEKGVPDGEIAEKLGVDYNVAQRYSTMYWKKKMEAKPEEND